jgi:hypothetical protein
MINEKLLEGIWKEACYPGICLGVSRETTKTFSQDR